jgi:hypothetical protein
MYAGRRAVVLFNAQLMPADNWEAELSVESVPITTIKVLRDAAVDGDIAAVKPDWIAHGIPVKKVTGGMREVTGKLHGFWKSQATVPAVGDTISLALRVDNLNFLVFPQCLIVNMNISLETTGAVEWDMEWEAIADGDFTGRF